ncbi:hypothetical protein IPG41_06760 [Candidatus Peregrinibacteria bacterium]|nr:MAG: hypothetical protein IPG41_06760 [Candidatus Peregrinibacteria bacterium]
MAFTLALHSVDSKRVLKLQPETFLLLVKQLRHFEKDAEIFEINLDKMKVKGDLKVIKNTFKNKEFIGVSSSLNLLKAATIAGWDTLKVPEGMEVDAEFTSLVKNRGTKILPS